VYDSDGNLTSDGNGNTFSFDPEGKLTASVVGGVSSTYKNDPFGHRAESVTGAGTFDYVYDPSGRLITEADTTCNSGAPYYPCTDFVYIGASSIPFSQFSDWVCCAAYATFNYYDYMGSLRETTSYLGLSSPYQNDPFGDNSSTAQLPPWFGFAEMLTPGSGVQLSSTRGYHQIEARWLTPDPLAMVAADPTNPQTWNLYAYVLNNPVSNVDPLGLFCVWDDGSYDSGDDPQSGDPSGCDKLGGTWFDGSPGDFGLDADWSPSPNAGLANQIAEMQGSADGTNPNGVLTLYAQGVAAMPTDDSGGGSWTGNFLSSFFGGFTLDFGPGSCLGVFINASQPVLKATNSVVKNAQKYGPPLIQSLPGVASVASQGLYSMANYAQQMKAPAGDVGMFTTAAAALNVAATHLGTLGQAALSAARNPYVLLGSVDAALAYGVGKEAVAAYRGECH